MFRLAGTCEGLLRRSQAPNSDNLDLEAKKVVVAFSVTAVHVSNEFSPN